MSLPTVIFCGGQGTRMKEETEFKPKPLVTVGSKPILWHIMKIYAHHGHNNFVLTLGYKGHMIKDYFLHEKTFTNDFVYNTKSGETSYPKDNLDEFTITFAETGLSSTTGSRLLQVQQYISGNEFMVTYGDGVADIDVEKLVKFHRAQGRIGTVTGVHPLSKYGLLTPNKDGTAVTDFKQKPRMSDYVSGGFMVFTSSVFDYLREDEEIEDALTRLAHEDQLSLYHHDGFWKAMDTYREMEQLNELWESDRPWEIWES